MDVHFMIRGRLGNAIFRYLACSIICIHYNAKYENNGIHHPGMTITEDIFKTICFCVLHSKPLPVLHNSILLWDFYQIDYPYVALKPLILKYISENPDHTVTTDGILADDKRCETFFMRDIVNTPLDFKKRYDNVLHLRIEDFISNGAALNPLRIKSLFDRYFLDNMMHWCIVCKMPISVAEMDYIKEICDYFDSRNIKFVLEHNSTLIDYYIMKEATTLICSMSTLGWSAAFFSDKLKKCCIPNNDGFQHPIKNTILY